MVILDWMNYIKGYRYELYCLARNAMSTLCVVHLDVSKDVAFARCEQQQSQENAFPIELFEDYTSRMEFPNSSKRWD